VGPHTILNDPREQRYGDVLESHHVDLVAGDP
jgi:hypothetical protein